jgi:hypothetical protein
MNVSGPNDMPTGVQLAIMPTVTISFVMNEIVVMNEMVVMTPYICQTVTRLIGSNKETMLPKLLTASRNMEREHPCPMVT